MNTIALSAASPAVLLDTTACFDTAHADDDSAPIDKFIVRHEELNKHAATLFHTSDSVSGLLLLGSVSAVEGYLRELLRRLIYIDPDARVACETLEVSYGAALSHRQHMLAESLLEGTSFIEKKTILDTIRNCLGLKGLVATTDFETSLDAFAIVCQLRHCMVHRFGKLGVRNAIKLGLESHRRSIEKPLRISYADMQLIFQINHAFVRCANKWIFDGVMERRAKKPNKNGECSSIVPWTWDYRKDRTQFNKLYRLFLSTRNPPQHLLGAFDAYAALRKATLP